MVGDWVLLRCHAGQPVVGRVYQEWPDVIGILSPQHFEAGDLLPIGFPKSVVFKYDKAAQSQFKAGAVQWEKLTPYK